LNERKLSFTSNTWTHEGTDRKRERLRRISDEKLERELIAYIYMCEPSLRRVMESYLYSASWHVWNSAGAAAEVNACSPPRDFLISAKMPFV
jgi:hypothetical protein